MQSPIPIEPMHFFSHAHLRQRHMARGRPRTAMTTTTTSHNMAPILVNLCMRMQLTPLQFDIRDPFHGQLTAVKARHPLTSMT